MALPSIITEFSSWYIDSLSIPDVFALNIMGHERGYHYDFARYLLAKFVTGEQGNWDNMNLIKIESDHIDLKYGNTVVEMKFIKNNRPNLKNIFYSEKGISNDIRKLQVRHETKYLCLFFLFFDVNTDVQIIGSRRDYVGNFEELPLQPDDDDDMDVFGDRLSRMIITKISRQFELDHGRGRVRHFSKYSDYCQWIGAALWRID